MQMHLLNSTYEDVRKEAVITFASIGPILMKPVTEQRTLALQFEAKGSGCDLFVSSTIFRELGDRKRSLQLLELAARKGSPSAEVNLGGHYLEKKDFKLAFKHYGKAAELGNPIAQHKLGSLYDFEGPYKRDIKQAIVYYTMGAENKNADSMNNLAMIIEDDGVVPPHDWTVHSLRQEAAKLGSVDAKIALAKSHFPLDADTDPAICKLLCDYLWESFVEVPAAANCALLLGMHYMPREDPPNPFEDPAKALYFLKRVKSGGMEETAGSWITSLESRGALKEKEPLVATLLTETAQRVAHALDSAHDLALRAALKEFGLATPEEVASVSVASAVCASEGCEAIKDLKLCLRCKAVSYCCREHQAAAWRTHKKTCGKTNDNGSAF
jgi:TPR repeat protein